MVIISAETLGLIGQPPAEQVTPQPIDPTPVVSTQHEECLREVMVEIMEIDPDNVALNLQNIYHKTKKYLKYDGDTVSREELMDTIAMALVGKSWPLCCDSQNYKQEFYNAIKPYQESF